MQHAALVHVKSVADSTQIHPPPVQTALSSCAFRSVSFVWKSVSASSDWSSKNVCMLVTILSNCVRPPTHSSMPGDSSQMRNHRWSASLAEHGSPHWKSSTKKRARARSALAWAVSGAERMAPICLDKKSGALSRSEPRDDNHLVECQRSGQVSMRSLTV
jgi:hypothetical protein